MQPRISASGRSLCRPVPLSCVTLPIIETRPYTVITATVLVWGLIIQFSHLHFLLLVAFIKLGTSFFAPINSTLMDYVHVFDTHTSFSAYVIVPNLESNSFF